MRNVPGGLSAHYQLSSMTLASAIKITRPDGSVYAFTSATDNAVISGDTYSAAQGLNVSSLSKSAGFNVDNLEMTTVDDGTLFTRSDLLAQKWQGSVFTIFQYNWANLSDGIDPIFSGTFGNVELIGNKVKIELRGLQQAFQQPVGKLISVLCRTQFGSAQCKKSVADYTGFGTVSSVANNRVFYGSTISSYTDSYWNNVGLRLTFDGVDAATTFTDVSPVPKTGTPIGNAQLGTAQFKFGSASGLFDGATDAVSYPDHADFEFGTGDFTIEFWIRPSQVAAAKHVLGKGNTSGFGPFMVYQNLAALRFYHSSVTNVWDVANGMVIGDVVTDVWSHVAISKTNGVIRTFLNGVVGATLASSSSLVNNTDAVIVGAGQASAVTAFAGWLDDLRITKGVGRYALAFAVPTAAHPVSYVTQLIVQEDPHYNSVVLLLRGEGTDGSTAVTDDSPVPKTVTAMGNAQIDIAQSKFGISSMLFDGSGDYLTTPNHADWSFGAGDFTIEMWVRFSVAPSPYDYLISSWGNSPSRAWILAVPPNADGFHFGWTLNGTTDFYAISGNTAINLNTWYHVAVVRSGANIKVYRDGVGGSPYSVGTSSLFVPTSQLDIGRSLATGAEASYFNGWLDDIRITKGVARYTSNFTPGDVTVNVQDDWYGNGVLEWLTGANAGVKQVVKSQTGPQLELVAAMWSPVAIGDTFKVIAGCRKRHITDCKDKFDNILNFDGEPHLPGMDKLTARTL